MSSTNYTDDITSIINSLVAKYYENPISKDPSVIPPLKRYPDCDKIDKVVESLILECNTRRTSTMFNIRAFSHKSYLFFVYKIPEFGWMLVSPSGNFAEPIYALHQDLFRIINFEKTNETKGLKRQFNISKIQFAQDEMIKKSKDTIGQYTELCWNNGEQFYLVHTFDDEWWIVNRDADYGYQTHFAKIQVDGIPISPIKI